MDQAVWEVIAAVATAAILTLAAVGLRDLRFKKQMRDDWRGQPDRPGVKGRPGVMERLASGDEHFQQIDGRLDTMNGEITSIKDTVDHLAAELPKNGVPVATKIDELYKHLILGRSEPSTAPTNVIVNAPGAATHE